MQNNNNWINRHDLDNKKNKIRKNIYEWLVLPSNLTEAIKKTGLNFSLNLVKQSLNKPSLDEISAFDAYEIDASFSFIRTVFLEGDQTPLIFARVIIPVQTYLSYYDKFSNLNNRAIGNTILYADKQIFRKDFEYKLIKNTDSLFQELQALHQLSKEDTYWARRSIFVLPKGPLLITELFLTAIPNYPL